MKINIQGILLGCLFSSVVLTNCDKKKNTSDCLSYQVAPITNINGPSTGTVNQDINFILSFGIFNGCGQFGNIEHNSNADTTTIKVNAKYQGCVCTQIAGTLQTTYTFRSTQPGTYYFKFLQADANYLLDTLIVQ